MYLLIIIFALDSVNGCSLIGGFNLEKLGRK